MCSSPGVTCREIIEDVTAYLEGALTPGGRERIETHCRICPKCRLYFAEEQAMVASLGQLDDRHGGLTDAEKARFVGLFHEHGHHHGAPRNPTIPLGLGGSLAAPGDHIAYFWETEEEFLATAGFVAAGEKQGESSVILCHGEAHERLATALGDVGLDVAALERENRLSFVSGANSADVLLEEIGEQVRSAVDRGTPLVRILGSLGWRQHGSPEDQELLRLEAQVTEAVRKLPVVVACTYEIRRISGRILLLGGFECHPLVFRRDTLWPNALYVTPGPLQATP